jgi:hypothetical protein
VFGGDLDDGLLDGELAGREVEVAGLRAMSSPQRRPVLIAVSTINRCWAGSAFRMASYSSGVRVRFFFLIFFGSSVCAQGLKVTRSTRARSKTECSMVWYLPTDAADRPFSVAVVTSVALPKGGSCPSACVRRWG